MSGWKIVEWDGNPELGYRCWRKKFGRGHVSVGIGSFLSIVYSYGPNDDESCSGTRWNYDLPPITEDEAMEEVDACRGKSGGWRHPKRKPKELRNA